MSSSLGRLTSALIDRTHFRVLLAELQFLRSCWLLLLPSRATWASSMSDSRIAGIIRTSERGQLISIFPWMGLSGTFCACADTFIIISINSPNFVCFTLSQCLLLYFLFVILIKNVFPNLLYFSSWSSLPLNYLVIFKYLANILILFKFDLYITIQEL